LAKTLEKAMAVQDNASKAYLALVERSFRRDYERELPASPVVPSSDATWLERDKTPNPARSPCFHCRQSPSRSACRKSLRMPRPTCSATLHEAVHYLRSGHGYSEIGGARHNWRSGDFIYTPPWTIYRHYNINAEPAELIIIENSKLLEALGLHERESFGLVSYADYLPTKRTSEVVGACSHEYTLSRQP
jgi:mannose-6-phosphate isomerase-like protein (cupin superfamily)